MSTDIAALIGSRICHDLISPIGAIGNGVELLEMSGTGQTGPELDLITDSVQNANARIRFFRVAYGAANPDSMIGRQEVLSVLAATAQGGRLTYFWKIDNDQPRQLVRIAFLLLQCFETALPLGGEIQITQDGDDWTLTGTGPRLKIDQALWDSLIDPDIEIVHKAAQVQFALVPSAVVEAKRKLTITTSEDTIRVQF